MLHELVVRNLGVIEHASVIVGPAMTVLTGETGAGKTLVTEAINLLTGGRADPGMVRPGAEEATVEGRFLLADGDEVVVRRVVPTEGRSRAYLDGNVATIAELTAKIAPLVEVHGQHGHQAMLRADARRRALDRFGDHDVSTLASVKRSLRDAQAQLEDLGGDGPARNRELDLLRFQIDEISQAGIDDPAEDKKLSEQEAILGDATGHRQAADAATELLSADGSVGAGLAEAIAALDDRAPFEPVTERLYSVQAEVADLMEHLRQLNSGIDDDPATLADIQLRREKLTELRRKYGSDLAEVLAFAAAASTRLEEIENHAERASQLQTEITKLQESEAAESAKLLKARLETAGPLAQAVQHELRQLALPAAVFKVAVSGQAGAEVDFEVSMNPGAPALPISKVASGGELSRSMLALQLVVGGDAGTVIYDEVDAGVGGEAATSIGQALAGVGDTHQVMVVTHLAQVAACANHHVQIVKTATAETTTTELNALHGQDRVVELARMLSGSPDSESARAHASELLGESLQASPSQPSRAVG